MTARIAVDRTPKPCLHKRANHRHGTHACYVLDRCRCLPCAAANRHYERDRAKRHAYGRFDTFTPAEPVRLHVQHLMTQGVGIKRISRLSGISTGTLSKLLYGTPTRGPSKRVLQATAATLLAVEPVLADGAKLPIPVGTVRRLQALIACGWSIGAISTYSGIDRQRIDPLLSYSRDTTGGTVRRIDALFEELWDVLPPESNQRERIAASRSRNRARRNGWPVPMAWDDIDDPDEQPNMGQQVRGIDLADVAWLERQGYPLDVIADRIGVTKSAIEHARQRAAA